MPGRQTPKKKKTPAKAALSGRSSRRRGHSTTKRVEGCSVRELCEEQLRAMDEPIANLKAMVDRMMEQLTPREREVLNQRFGISKGLPLV